MLLLPYLRLGRCAHANADTGGSAEHRSLRGGRRLVLSTRWSCELFGGRDGTWEELQPVALRVLITDPEVQGNMTDTDTSHSRETETESCPMGTEAGVDFMPLGAGSLGLSSCQGTLS